VVGTGGVAVIPADGEMTAGGVVATGVNRFLV
jgi:hypothetical protein